MSPAVGLAFLLAGGATSLPAAVAVWALVRPRVFAAYLAFAGLGSTLAAHAFAAVLCCGGCLGRIVRWWACRLRPENACSYPTPLRSPPPGP
ncbi:hypothetical protein [Elioraea thermophila]|uniref:hypothetical protein n=1 Tax=Elioraea thermophila TaxID=2185104 RepID=UPI0018E5857C|nr:hypothetical protein [Elioraea thermophila]